MLTPSMERVQDQMLKLTEDLEGMSGPLEDQEYSSAQKISTDVLDYATQVEEEIETQSSAFDDDLAARTTSLDRDVRAFAYIILYNFHLKVKLMLYFVLVGESRVKPPTYLLACKKSLPLLFSSFFFPILIQSGPARRGAFPVGLNGKGGN